MKNNSLLHKLWKKYTPEGKIYRKRRNEIATFKPQLSEQRILDALQEAGYTVDRSPVTMPSSFIISACKQQDVIWIQFQSDGKLSNVLRKINETRAEVLISKIIKETDYIATGLNELNEVMKDIIASDTKDETFSIKAVKHLSNAIQAFRSL